MLFKLARALLISFLVFSSTAAYGESKSQTGLPTLGESWALVVGAGKYQRWPSLKYPRKDSEVFYNVLQHRGFKPIILRDKKAEYKRIRWIISKELKNRSRENDQVLLFFATHVKSALNRNYGNVQNHFISYNTDLFLLDVTSVGQEFLIDRLSKWAAKRIMIIADNCYFLNLKALKNRLDSIPGQSISWLTAGGKGEEMVSRDGHSVFLKSLEKALTGYGDENCDGVVTGRELIKYVQETVPRETEGKQHPQAVISDKGDQFYFVIDQKAASLRNGKPGQRKDPDSLCAYSEARESVFGQNVAYHTVWGDDSKIKMAETVTVSAKIEKPRMKPSELFDLEIISTLKEAEVFLDHEPLGKTTFKYGEPSAYYDQEVVGKSIVKTEAGKGKHSLLLIRRRENGRHFQYSGRIEVKKGAENRFVIDKFEELEPPADMVLIPAGEFIMGSKKGKRNEQPAHKVFLDSFYMDKYEVTNADFHEFVKATGYRTETERRGYGWVYVVAWTKLAGANWRRPFGPHTNIKDKDDYPVVQVSWDDAAAYARWAGKRLPTEAEWEKAARGNGLAAWPWGTMFGPRKANIAGEADGFGYLAPVGSFRRIKSPYGTFDMAGNVWEWCSDWYSAAYYKDSPSANPPGQPAGKEKVMRGGSWSEKPINARVSVRQKALPKGAANDTGFRCAMSVKNYNK